MVFFARGLPCFPRESWWAPEDIAERPEFPRWLAQTVYMNERLGAMPMVAGNTLELLPEYHASLASMANAIREANTTVHVEFYIMSFDVATRDSLQHSGKPSHVASKFVFFLTISQV